MKKILSLVVSGLLVGSLMVGCSDDTKDKTENSNNTRQEQKAFKEEIITDNEYIKMTLVGKEKNEYGFIALKVLVENKTDNDLIVYTDNTQVNGVMNNPYWCCNVNGKSKSYSFIEWDPDSDTNANVKTVEDLKNIKGDIYITGDDYVEIFRTQVSILSNETKETSKSTDEEENEVLATKPVLPEKTTESNKNTETKDITSKDNKTTQKNTTKDESEKNNSTNKKNTTKKEDTTKKEEPKQKGYYVTCPNGHKVYTENGDWNCNQCEDDYMKQQEEEDFSSDDNIDDETGLAKVKDGTHLGENNPEADYVDTYNKYWHGEYEEGSDEYNDAYNKLYGDDTEDTTE